MANPVIVALPKNTWVKVANGVTTGMIWLRSLAANYIVMHQLDNPSSAPSDLTQAVRVFLSGCNSLAISATVNKDVYLYSIDVDAEVRADL